MADAESTPDRPCIPEEARRFSSRLDATKGTLRTTSDGNLVDEDTGDWLILDTPPHDEEDREIAQQKDKRAAKGPAISLHEAKKGATGLDNPRQRKPLMRLLRNRLSGSDRPPKEAVDSPKEAVDSPKEAVDSPKEVVDPDVLAKQDLRAQLLQQREERKNRADTKTLEKVRALYASQISQYFGGDWFEHAMIEPNFWSMMRGVILDREIE